MPAEIELTDNSKMQYEGGGEGEEAPAEAPPRKLNKMEKQKEKHKEKLDAFNIREASKIGDKVINLDRTGMTDPFFCGLLVVVFLATIGLGIYGFTAGGTVAFAPFLYDGTQCGHFKSVTGASDLDATQYPYLYFPVRADGNDVGSLWDDAICVKSCPDLPQFPKEYLAANDAKYPFDENGTPTVHLPYETRRFGLSCRPADNADNNNKDLPVYKAKEALFKDVTKTKGG